MKTDERVKKGRKEIFIGREKELDMLNMLFKKNASSLVVIEGRRRIGKSRLVNEFAKGHTFYSFSGVAPSDKTTRQSQLDEFAAQLAIQTGMPEVKVDNWNKLFFFLSKELKEGKIVLLFDEITWMGSKDPDFLGKLKNAWDIYFKSNPELIFILCGSMSAWIEKNILSSTGFVGRISYRLRLQELSLRDCAKFWNNEGSVISSYEKFKVLCITGGVPRYLEEIKPHLSAEENIKNMCFMPGSLPVNEFRDIFSDLFSKRSDTYKKIIETLSMGSLDLQTLCKKLKMTRSGYISQCLDDLIKSDFVTRDYAWNFNSGDQNSLSQFRLSDNYLRFYLKYIDQNRTKIDNGEFVFKSLVNLPNWKIIIGLQFENLVLKNKSYINECLKLTFDEIVMSNPYFQRKTARHPGCQIDYLIQTKFKTFYVCEIKFSEHPIGLEIIPEMKKKLSAFKTLKGFSVRPVLIHVNGVTEDLQYADYFSDIIDFSKILE